MYLSQVPSYLYFCEGKEIPIFSFLLYKEVSKWWSFFLPLLESHLEYVFLYQNSDSFGAETFHRNQKGLWIILNPLENSSSDPDHTQDGSPQG